MQQDYNKNNKRIAKNSFFLYIRTFFTLLIALYTSRLVLQTLGVEDYGIYNVVGGFVSLFTLLSGALSNAISRYITFELGKGNHGLLKEVFSTSITVQCLLAFIIVVLAEIVGWWFLNYKMNVPNGRMNAANWVFQCSLLTFAINLISIPYNACIIAHERMKSFAYVSILEAMLKLVAVSLLLLFCFDRLKLYAVFLVLIAAFIRFIYGVYCGRHFEECHYHFTLNKKLIKEMTTLAGWNMLGSSGSILTSHGINLLMNLFFGVTVNAARGLAVQVNSAVTQFINSFTTAVNPQITKSYAISDKEYTFKLVMMSSKYSFMLMFFLASPIILETPYILKLWLHRVPEYTVLFVRLTLINSLVATLSTSLYFLALATGNIKKYQIVVGTLSLSCFFITYFFYRFGSPVETAYYINIIIQFLILVSRLKILSELTGLNIKDYLRKVFFKAGSVALFFSFFALILKFCIQNDSFINFIVSIFLCVILTTLTIFFIGLTTTEQKYLLSLLRKRLK